MQSKIKSETICTALRKQIIERTIPPETKLTASKLSDIFRVSRTPIREALWVLESEGLIDYSPNKGFKVNRITIEDIDKIYAVRVHNEGLAGRLSTQVISRMQEELKVLEKLCKAMEISSRNRNISEYVEANKEFHRLIISHCGNEWLVKTLKFLNLHLDRFVIKAAGIPDHFEKSMKEHWKIFDELKKGNGTGVEKAIRTHLIRASGDLRKEIMREGGQNRF